MLTHLMPRCKIWLEGCLAWLPRAPNTTAIFCRVLGDAPALKLWSGDLYVCELAERADDYAEAEWTAYVDRGRFSVDGLELDCGGSSLNCTEEPCDRHELMAQEGGFHP